MKNEQQKGVKKGLKSKLKPKTSLEEAIDRQLDKLLELDKRLDVLDQEGLNQIANKGGEIREEYLDLVVSKERVFSELDKLRSQMVEVSEKEAVPIGG